MATDKTGECVCHFESSFPIKSLSALVASHPEQVLVLRLLPPCCILQVLDGRPVLEAGEAAAFKLVVSLKLLPPIVATLAVVHLPVAF